MKTTLRQQKDLIDGILREGRVIGGIKLLRDFLRDNGYEGEGECKHYAIMRTSGTCMQCKAQVTEPVVLDSDEALEALRTRLRG